MHASAIQHLETIHGLHIADDALPFAAQLLRGLPIFPLDYSSSPTLHLLCDLLCLNSYNSENQKLTLQLLVQMMHTCMSIALTISSPIIFVSGEFCLFANSQ